MLHDQIANFLRVPAGNAFGDLRNAVLGSPDYYFYDGALRALEPLASTAPRAFLSHVPSCTPGFLLTPRVHVLVALCARAIGDETRAKYEFHFARSCLAGIFGAGTGEAFTPWPVTHVEDEYDVLDRLGARPIAWRREVSGGGILETVNLEDGRTIHFDISSSSTLAFGDTPA